MDLLNFETIKIDLSATLHNALEKMTKNDGKLLIVMSDSKFVGLLSAGDIQRAILGNRKLDTCISEILRKNVKVAFDTDDENSIKEMMLRYRMEFCPVITSDKKIISIIYWKDIFGEEKVSPKQKFNLPIVVMAGGYGTRLRPITHVIPKPLIPIGEKTMLEEIFDRFSIYGCDEFHLSVNFKSDLIKYYIASKQLPYRIDYFQEEKPCGTAGSLTLVKEKITSTFFVTNCDILIEEDYSDILQFHRDNKNEITVVAAIKQMSIPYGIMHLGENGDLLSLEEKPNYSFFVNTGFYILEPTVFELIPEAEFFHITTLIEKLKHAGRKVGVYPVTESSWVDVGDWQEYYKALDKKNIKIR
jgi:dTDP-glucose pyrophosphorylase